MKPKWWPCVSFFGFSCSWHQREYPKCTYKALDHACLLSALASLCSSHKSLQFSYSTKSFSLLPQGPLPVLLVPCIGNSLCLHFYSKWALFKFFNLFWMNSMNNLQKIKETMLLGMLEFKCQIQTSIPYYPGF